MLSYHTRTNLNKGNLTVSLCILVISRQHLLSTFLQSSAFAVTVLPIKNVIEPFNNSNIVASRHLLGSDNIIQSRWTFEIWKEKI